MHEQSETVQGPDGRWYNIYGRGVASPFTGQVLPGERPYDTVDEAVKGARRRSQQYSDEEGHQRPRAKRAAPPKTSEPLPAPAPPAPPMMNRMERSTAYAPPPGQGEIRAPSWKDTLYNDVPNFVTGYDPNNPDNPLLQMGMQGIPGMVMKLAGALAALRGGQAVLEGARGTGTLVSGRATRPAREAILSQTGNPAARGFPPPGIIPMDEGRYYQNTMQDVANARITELNRANARWGAPPIGYETGDELTPFRGFGETRGGGPFPELLGMGHLPDARRFDQALADIHGTPLSVQQQLSKRRLENFKRSITPLEMRTPQATDYFLSLGQTPVPRLPIPPP